MKGAVGFLGCIGGFVGSDMAAGLVATGFLESDREQVLMDLGTNGEIAAGSCRGIRWCRKRSNTARVTRTSTRD